MTAASNGPRLATIEPKATVNMGIDPWILYWSVDCPELRKDYQPPMAQAVRKDNDGLPSVQYGQQSFKTARGNPGRMTLMKQRTYFQLRKCLAAFFARRARPRPQTDSQRARNMNRTLYAMLQHLCRPHKSAMLQAE